MCCSTMNGVVIKPLAPMRGYVFGYKNNGSFEGFKSIDNGQETGLVLMESRMLTNA